MQNSSKIILGIDPGTLVMGYAVIRASGQKMELLTMSSFRLKGTNSNYERLRQIHVKVREVIDQFQPDCFAIEAPFFGKNVQSMLKLGRAQGVAIAAAMQSGLAVFEYPPRRIKQSITGNGNAAKEQVWKMLQHILALPESGLKYMDASDALATAVCHHFQGLSPKIDNRSKTGNWSDFISRHPQRIRNR